MDNQAQANATQSEVTVVFLKVAKQTYLFVVAAGCKDEDWSNLPYWPISRNRNCPFVAPVRAGEDEFFAYARNGSEFTMSSPGLDRTDGHFHAMQAEMQPEICFQVVSKRSIGRKPAHSALLVRYAVRNHLVAA